MPNPVAGGAGGGPGLLPPKEQVVHFLSTPGILWASFSLQSEFPKKASLAFLFAYKHHGLVTAVIFILKYVLAK